MTQPLPPTLTNANPSAPAKSSRMALTAMILGIASLPLTCILIGPFAGLIALILGLMALRTINRAPASYRGKGWAITGLVTGAVGLIFGTIMVASMVVPMLAYVGLAGRAAEEARMANCQADMSNIERALSTFEIDTGRYPTTGEGLAALMTPPAGIKGWTGPYLQKLPVDPWGMPYIYTYPSAHTTGLFDLYSFGPDKVEGGGDDIVNGSSR
jgi:general secretion pathway protein G